MEQCSFQIKQKSRNTHLQNPEHSVSISLQDEALHINLCPSVLTSVIFLATDMLSQLTPSDESQSKSRYDTTYNKGRKKESIIHSATVHSDSPILITNEYGRKIRVWWKIEAPDKVGTNLHPQ